MGKPIKFVEGAVAGSASLSLVSATASQFIAIKSVDLSTMSEVAATGIVYEYGTGSRIVLKGFCGSGQDSTALHCGDSEVYLGTGSDLYIAADGGKASASVAYEIR